MKNEKKRDRERGGRVRERCRERDVVYNSEH